MSLGCRDGFYGLNCNETCSANCTEGKCDIYGGCHCEKGVLDKFCYIDCTDNCIGGACDVDLNGQLKCLQGCKEGRMGLFCNEWCPNNCPACNSSCVSRVMKRRTERETPNNCFESSTCKDGYRGPQCDISCPACRYDRHCNLSCAGGSWGEECHFDCPQHCSRASFDGRSLCDFENGLCKSGCLQGYFGYKCKHICPDTCHKNYCYLNNGSCTWGCDPEHWGPSCEYRCGKCKDMKCERNGSCTCIEGYYGPRCEVECSDRCKGNCSITMNGSHICETECKTGFTGVDCQARCPSDCSRGCNREDGTCADTKPPTPTSQGLHYTPAYLFHIPFTVIGIIGIFLIIIIACIIKWKIKEQADSSNPPPENIDQRADLLNPPPGNIDERADLLNPPPGNIDKRADLLNPPPGNIDEQADSSNPPEGKIDEQKGLSKNEELKVHLPNEGKDDQQHTEPARQLEETGSIIVERGLIAEECEYLLGPGFASKEG